jgi:hypothetical protein
MGADEAVSGEVVELRVELDPMLSEPVQVEDFRGREERAETRVVQAPGREEPYSARPGDGGDTCDQWGACCQR